MIFYMHIKYHGTSIRNSELIMKGFWLSSMNRQTIYIVEDKKNVLYYSKVIIKIDIQKAKSLGIKFIKSDNNYILSRDIINLIKIGLKISFECL